MHIIRKAIPALGGIFLAALLITALAPKAARGVVAALVQVANTTANPVPTLAADNPANEPFHARLCRSVGGAVCELPDSVLIPTTTSDGRTVKRLVIEYVSGTVLSNTASPSFIPNISVQVVQADNVVTGQSEAESTFVNSPLALAAGIPISFGQSVRIYADPGQTVQLSVVFDGSSNAECVAGMNGYFVTE